MNGQRKHILIRQNITEQWEEMKSIRSLLIWPSCKEAGHKRPHIWFHSEISRAFRHANAGGGVALKWPRVRRCQTVETDHMAAVQGRSLTTAPWAARKERSQPPEEKKPSPAPSAPRGRSFILAPLPLLQSQQGPGWLRVTSYHSTSHDWHILTHHMTDISWHIT